MSRPWPRRSRFLVTAALAATVVTGGAVATVAHSDDSGPPATDPVPSTGTAAITRGDVVDTESVDGKLTYGTARAIPAAARGVATWLPTAGDTVSRGHTLLRVDNRPVTLMYGSLPLYRTLRTGIDDGPDVRELERNLAALGYGDDLTVDEHFSAATAAAVEDWQADRDLSETGLVDAAQVVFQSGRVRISDVLAQKGDSVGGGPALKVTAVAPHVHVDLSVDKQDLVRKGGRVQIEMPSGATVTGKITAVGRVATASQDGAATIGVDLSLTHRAAGRLDQAPVTVDLVSRRAVNVLSVPVEALLGLREGGFGVQLVDGASTRVVAVTTGTYGASRVEVSGAGLRAGQKVQVPTS